MAYGSPLFVGAQPGGIYTVVDQSFTTGNIFFVSSTHANASNSTGAGRSPSTPFATLDYAVGQCTANNGDVIYVMPGHAETGSAAAFVDLDVAGITVNGLGVGSNRPTFTFGTATTCDIDIDAANITIRNMRFVSNIDSLATFLDVNESNFTCERCEFVSSSAKEVVCFVDIATTKDGVYFTDCRFFQPTDPAGSDGAAATGCFYFVDSEDLIFTRCFFYGNFETAIWHNKTTAAKNVWIVDCYGTQLLAAAEVTTQVANMEGGAVRSYFTVSGSADVAEANTWGTLSDKFFIDINSSVGNDGANGQLAVAGATAAT